MNILFSRDLCAALVLTFGHFLWIGTLVAIVTSIVVRRQQTSRGRYGVWLTGLLVMAGSPLVTFAILQAIPAAVPPVVEMVKPAPPFDSPLQLPEAAPTHSETDHYSDIPSQLNDHSDELLLKSVPSSADVPAAEAQKAPAPTVAMREPGWWRDYAPLVTSLYLIGVALMGLRLLLGLWGGHKLRYQSDLITQRWMLDALQRQADALGLILVPAMAYCERVTVPTVLGILQPMILLPMTLASGLTPDQIESVLAHELAHLRRYDHLVNLLQCVIESLLFFHPAVWWLSRRVRDEREHCCDDLVIASGAVPLDYAASLLRVAELSREAEQRAHNQRRTFTAASLFAIGDRPSTLRQRIARLLGYQTELHVRAVHSWVLFCLATCCVGAIWVLTSTTWIVLAEISRDRSQKTIIITWSAIVDDSVMNEIRAINGLVTKETGSMQTPDDAKFSTLRCSAEELRAILKNHADNKRLVALQKTIRHSMPTGGWRIGAEKRFFQMIDSEVVQTEEKTDPSYHVNWHADGNETRDEDSDRARLIVEGNYNFRQEGMVPVVKPKVDMPSDGDADKATKHQTGTILSKANVKFDSVMSDGESTLVILSPPAVVRQYSELVKDTKGQHYETKTKQAPKLHAIFVHEAVRVPVKQLDHFHKLTRVEDWVRRGSNATKEHAARITEWQSRPSRSVFDADAAFTRRLGTGGYVQLVGLGRPKEAQRIWWTPTGEPLLNVSDLADQLLSNYELAAIVRVWETGASRVQEPPFGMRGYGNVIEIPDRFSTPGSQLLIVHAMLDRATGKASLKFGAGFGAWTAETTIGKATGSTATLNGVAITTQTAFEHQGFDPASRSSQPKLITVTSIPFNLKPTPDFEFTGHAVTANESITEFEWGPRAYANESKASLSINHPGPQAEIQHFLIKSRPIHWTEFNDFATEPAVPLVPPLEFGKEQETDVRPFSAKLPGGVTVNLVGVGMPPSQPRAWWQANGTPLSKRPNASLNGYHSNGFPNQADCREIALELVGLPQDHFVTAQVGSNVSGVAFSNFQNGVKAYNIASGPFSELETTSVQVSLAIEPLGPVQRIDFEGRKLAEVDIAPELKSLYNRIQPIRVESHNDRQELLLKPMGDFLLVADWRLYAIDTNGKEVPPATSNANDEGSVWSFKLARENLARFEYRLRPYRHWVKFENVSLQPGKQTEIKVTVSAAPKPQQFVVNLPHGLSVEFVGLAEMGKDDKNWWKPDGEPLGQVPAQKAAGIVSVTGQEMRRTLIRVHGAKSHLDVTTNMTGERTVEATDSGESFVSFVGGLGIAPPQKTARVEVGVATVPLSPLRRIDSTGKRLPNEANAPVDHIAEDITILSVAHPRLRVLGDHKVDGRPMSLKPDEIAENEERRKQTEITFLPPVSLNRLDFQMMLIDTDGETHTNHSSSYFFDKPEVRFTFNVPLDRVARFEYRLRPYQHWVTYDNVSVHSGKTTDVKVTVASLPTPKPPHYIANLPDGRSVEFVGITKNTAAANEGWKPDGRPIGDVGYWPATNYISGNTHGSFTENGEHPEPNAGAIDLLFRFRGLKAQPSISFDLATKGSSYPHLPLKEPYELRVSAERRDPPPPDSKWTIPDGEMRVGLTDEPWGKWLQISPTGEVLNPLTDNDLYRSYYEQIQIMRIEPHERAPNKLALVLRTPQEMSRRFPFEIRGIDPDEKPQWVLQWEGKGIEGTDLIEGRWGLATPEKKPLTRFEFRLRPYRHWVTFTGVSVEPGQESDVKLKAESVNDNGRRNLGANNQTIQSTDKQKRIESENQINAVKLKPLTKQAELDRFSRQLRAITPNDWTVERCERAFRLLGPDVAGGKERASILLWFDDLSFVSDDFSQRDKSLPTIHMMDNTRIGRCYFVRNAAAEASGWSTFALDLRKIEPVNRIAKAGLIDSKDTDKLWCHAAFACDVEIGKDGRRVPILGKVDLPDFGITHLTKFLVVGELPDPTKATNDEAKQAAHRHLESFKKLQEEARQHHVPIVTAADFAVQAMQVIKDGQGYSTLWIKDPNQIVPPKCLTTGVGLVVIPLTETSTATGNRSVPKATSTVDNIVVRVPDAAPMIHGEKSQLQLSTEGPMRLIKPTDEQLQAAIKVFEDLGGSYESRHRTVDEHTFQLGRGKNQHVTDEFVPKIPTLPFAFGLYLNATQITAKGLRELAKLDNLVALYLGRAQVTDDGLVELARFKNLVKLQISDCDVTETGLKQLGNLQSVRELNIPTSPLSDAWVREAAKIEHLATLRLPTVLSNEGFKSLGRMQNLKKLVIAQGQISDAGWAELATLRNLSELHLPSDLKLTSTNLKQLAKLENLTTLSLQSSTITDDGIEELAGLGKLKWLDLSDTNISDTGLKHVGRFGQLEYLRIESTKMTDVGLKELASLRYLKRLYLGYNRISDDGISELVGLKNLVSLNLYRTGITDPGLKHVAQLPNLAFLDIRHTRITAVGLKELSNLDRLTSLLIAGSQDRDDPMPTLQNIALLKNLTHLTVWNFATPVSATKEISSLQHLTHLGLHGNITDAELRELASSTSIQNLDINSRLVTDKGLQSLASLHTLNELYMRRSQVTLQGKAKLQEALPNCDLDVLDINQFNDVPDKIQN